MFFLFYAIIMQDFKSKLEMVELLSMQSNLISNNSKRELARVRSQINNYKWFLSDFFEVLNCGWLYGSLFNTNLLPKNWKKLYIVLWSEKWCCWSMNNRIFSDVTKTLDSNSDVFCIWKKSFDYFVDKWANIVWYLHNCDKSTDFDLLYKYLSDSINLWIYSDIVLFFNSKHKKINLSLYSFSKEDLDMFVSQFGLNLVDVKSENTVELLGWKDLIKEMFIQLSQHVIYGAWLQNRVEELWNRKSLFTNRKRVDVMRKIVLSFNQKRQMLLTQRVMELMSTEYAVS